MTDVEPHQPTIADWGFSAWSSSGSFWPPRAREVAP